MKKTEYKTRCKNCKTKGYVIVEHQESVKLSRKLHFECPKCGKRMVGRRRRIKKS